MRGHTVPNEHPSHHTNTLSLPQAFKPQSALLGKCHPWKVFLGVFLLWQHKPNHPPPPHSRSYKHNEGWHILTHHKEYVMRVLSTPTITSCPEFCVQLAELKRVPPLSNVAWRYLVALVSIRSPGPGLGTFQRCVRTVTNAAVTVWARILHFSVPIALPVGRLNGSAICKIDQVKRCSEWVEEFFFYGDTKLAL